MLPTSLVIASFLSFGPELQYITTGLLESDGRPLYSTLYDDGLTTFPSMWDWFVGVLISPYSLAAALSVFGSLYSSRPIHMVAIFAAICFTLLSIIDVISLSGAKSYSYILGSIGFNLLGSIITSCIYITAIYIYERNVEQALVANKGIVAIYPVASLLASLAITCFGYYAIRTVLYPTPINITASIGPNIDGYLTNPFRSIYSKDKISEEQQGKILPFSALPQDRTEMWLKATAPEGTLRVAWQRQERQARYDVNVGVFSNCWGYEDIGPKKFRPIITASDIEHVFVKTEGHAAFRTTGSVFNGNIDISKPVKFWTNVKNGLPETSFFFLMDGITIRSGSGFSYYIGGPLIKTDGKASKISPRTFTVGIDGREYTVLFERQNMVGNAIPGSLERIVNEWATESCAAAFLPPGGDKKSIDLTVPFYINSVGLVIQIQQRRTRDGRFYTVDGELTVDKFNGWLSANGIRKTGKALIGGGHLGLLHVTGDISNFVVDGRGREIPPGNALTFLGDINLTSIDNSKILVEGRADAAWENRRRINPTLWERFSVELKIAIFGMLGAIVSTFFVTLCRPAIGRLFKKDTLLTY